MIKKKNIVSMTVLHKLYLPSTFCSYNEMGTFFLFKSHFLWFLFIFIRLPLYVFQHLDTAWRHQGDELPPGMERDNSWVNTHLGGLMLKEFWIKQLFIAMLQILSHCRTKAWISGTFSYNIYFYVIFLCEINNNDFFVKCLMSQSPSIYKSTGRV